MDDNKTYKTHFKNLDEMSKSVGKELGISNWIEITQDKINDLFAKITEDEQWIHIDKEKSKNIPLQNYSSTWFYDIIARIAFFIRHFSY